MTQSDRIAATECVNVMNLLGKAKTPHAMELMILIAMRLVRIADQGATGAPMADQDLQEYISISRELAATQVRRVGGGSPRRYGR